MADDYFRQNFNTKLSPKEESDYKLWLVDQATKRGRDMSQDDNDYDMRGYFKAGVGLDNSAGHFPDTFKKPNHPTFSDESQYSGTPNPNGGKYVGGKYVGGKWGNANGVDTYAPSREMLQSTHNPQQLQQYFRKFEPASKLVLPQ